jgi:hypothetical protein
MSARQKARPDWYPYLLATGVGVFVAFIIANLQMLIGH